MLYKYSGRILYSYSRKIKSYKYLSIFYRNIVLLLLKEDKFWINVLEEYLSSRIFYNYSWKSTILNITICQKNIISYFEEYKQCKSML